MPVMETAKAAQAALNEGKVLSQIDIDLEPIRELGLLTAKPFIFVFNVDEQVLTDAARKAELEALVAEAEARAMAGHAWALQEGRLKPLW